MTKAELCEFVDVSPRFIELEVQSGALRAVRIGGKTVRFLPEDISRWLNARPTR